MIRWILKKLAERRRRRWCKAFVKAAKRSDQNAIQDLIRNP